MAKVLKTAAIVVGVVAGALATGGALGIGALAAGGSFAGLAGVSWTTIATAAAVVGAGLNLLSPSKPALGSKIGALTEWVRPPPVGALA